MTIEDRLSKVDLNTTPVNTDFRAAIHQKLSGAAEININAVRSQLNHSLVLPQNSAITKKLQEIHSWWFANDGNRELISLSPVGVSGVDQLLTKTSPLKIAHLAGQPMDVVADPTIQLAIEAYRRRGRRDETDIHLGAFHTCIRLQAYSDELFQPVFEMFGTLDSLKRDPSREFEQTTIGNLIDNYSKLISVICPMQTIEVVIGNLNVAKKLISASGEGKKSEAFTEKQQAVTEALPQYLRGSLPPDLLNETDFTANCDGMFISPEVNKIRKLVNILGQLDGIHISFCLDRVYGTGHYNGLAFTMFVNGIDIVDGGTVDWVGNLYSNSRERTVVSGMGTQLLAGLALMTD